MSLPVLRFIAGQQLDLPFEREDVDLTGYALPILDIEYDSADTLKKIGTITSAVDGEFKFTFDDPLDLRVGVHLAQVTLDDNSGLIEKFQFKLDVRRSLG